LSTTFGFELSEMPMPEGGMYYILNSGGKPRGGLCPAFNEAIAGRWLNWVQVEDVDAALDRVTDGGGDLITGASDYPGVGRMAIVSDPTGATFGLITPLAG
jgi:predicted enzyme related to lactoylglutathione lyase